MAEIGERWKERQGPQSLAKDAGSEAQHTHLHVPVAVVDHPEMNVNLGFDLDQALHHGGYQQQPLYSLFPLLTQQKQLAGLHEWSYL